MAGANHPKPAGFVIDRLLVPDIRDRKDPFPLKPRQGLNRIRLGFRLFLAEHVVAIDQMFLEAQKIPDLRRVGHRGQQGDLTHSQTCPVGSRRQYLSSPADRRVTGFNHGQHRTEKRLIVCSSEIDHSIFGCVQRPNPRPAGRCRKCDEFHCSPEPSEPTRPRPESVRDLQAVTYGIHRPS